MLIASAAIAFFNPELAILPEAVFLILLLTTIPFAYWAFQKDKMVGIVSPFVLILRTGAFGMGLAAGTAREIISKEDRKKK